MDKKREQDFADLEVNNYNMLDGVLNNQAPPPEEKELDKVKEPPHKRRSREREER